MTDGPWNTPLGEWPDGWLKLEVASLSRMPEYLTMTDAEKHAAKLPVTAEEMREFIRKNI
jgi:hypothetical protein